MRELVLFTQSYPYDLAMEDSFIEPELPYLQNAFDRVVIVPGARSSTRAATTAEVDDSLARELARAGRVTWVRHAMLSPIVHSDLRERPGLVRQPSALARLAALAGQAEIVRRWARARFRDAKRALAYTFWCDQMTAGLCLAREDLPALVVASRAHGIDLYPERHDPPYLPGRRFTLERLAALFPDSERGARYVDEHHAWFGSCEPALMGVADPGFASRPSTDGGVRVVSCSRLVPIKRVDRIVIGLADAARRHPERIFEWTHFGEGALRGEILELVRREFPQNARAELAGYPSLDAVLGHYKSKPVDVFMNTSESEGTPVAIMEAISCSIPIIATDVGGNPEIASSSNGALVGASPSPRELGDAILSIAGDEAKRRGSRLVWQRKYDAQTNYSGFARRLVELSEARPEGIRRDSARTT